MSSFFYILSSFFPDINTKEGAYHMSSSEKIIINTNFVEYSFLNTYNYSPIDMLYKFKYKNIHKNIITNPFISKENAYIIFDKFSKAQSIYFAFCKIARIFKINHAKKYDINTDFCMTPLDSFKKTILIKIYDDTTKTTYTFRLSDIINIINTSLSAAPDFFVEPLHIKNPYTNIPFSTAQLYNIYFSLHNSYYIMPILFQQYFINNFDLHNFSMNNEVYIRDISIRNFISNGDDEKKYEYVYEMLKDFNKLLKNIVIHINFPHDKLTRTFEPYLYDYLISKYSLQPMLKFNSKRSLRKKLSKFNKLNPTYGRKIYYNRYTRNTPFSFNPTALMSEQLLLEGASFTPPPPYHENPLSYTFVDTVFKEETPSRQRPQERFLMGLSEMQTIIPPIAVQHNRYDGLTDNVRQSLNTIIDNININNDNNNSDIDNVISQYPVSINNTDEDNDSNIENDINYSENIDEDNASVVWRVLGGGSDSDTNSFIVEPTTEPTIEPTTEPTIEPTIEPTVEPNVEPNVETNVEPNVGLAESILNQIYNGNTSP